MPNLSITSVLLRVHVFDSMIDCKLAATQAFRYPCPFIVDSDKYNTDHVCARFRSDDKGIVV